VKFAVLGCGYVANQYLSLPERYSGLELVGCADLDPNRSQALAKQFQTQAMTVEQLLSSDAALVVNLTPHAAHAQTTIQLLEADKHVYSEKPIALTLPEAHAIQQFSQAKNLRVGCAPDTFLGATWQGVRQAIDQKQIGEVVNVQLLLYGRGPEYTVPNSTQYYQETGLLFDLPAYPITNMVALFGSVQTVTAVQHRNPQPRHDALGKPLSVASATHFTCVLEFACGVPITLTLSMDVQTTKMPSGEIHGTHGSILLPRLFRWADLAFFKTTQANYRLRPIGQLPLPEPIWKQHLRQWIQNPLHTWQALPLPRWAYRTRGGGVQDMAHAIQSARPHRASLELAIHVLEVTLAIRQSATLGQRLTMQSQVQKPPVLEAFQKSQK
jgi:predicted dehydrogenase